MTSLRKHTSIGIFVLGAILLAVIVITVLGSGRLFSDTTRFVLLFENSVSGLNVGAPVLFRGVKVGQVTDIRLMADPKQMQVVIPVIIEIKPFGLRGEQSDQNLEQTVESLVSKGLRGQLAVQSLITGQYQILLDFHPHTQMHTSDIQTKYPEIPTIPSNLQELTSRVSELPLQDMAQQLSQILNHLDRLLGHEDVDQSLALLKSTLEQTSRLSSQLNQDLPATLASVRSTSDTARETIQQAGEDFNQLSLTIAQTADQANEVLSNTDQRLGPMLSALEQTFTTAGSTLEQTRTSLTKLSGLIDRDSGLNHELQRTLQEIQRAAKSVQTLSDYLERHPESLLRGKGEGRY
ncbi:MAG: MlaD family protein [Desulfovermiculus sp.]